MYEINDYQSDARRFINPDLDIIECRRHAAFGLCSEAGEVSSLFQKVYQGHDMDTEHLKKEMGDVLWFLAELATAYGFTLGDVAKMNIDKLTARYPNGFEVQKSLNRKEGDI